jgi:hypothetical protein
VAVSAATRTRACDNRWPDPVGPPLGTVRAGDKEEEDGAREKEQDGHQWGTVEKPKDPTKPAATCDTEALAQNSASLRFISRQNVHTGSPTGTVPLTSFETYRALEHMALLNRS